MKPDEPAAGERGATDQPHRVRLPGFIADDADIGLGDLMKRGAAHFGIPACGGCDSRAAALNRWMMFTGKRQR
jgi:hypothetical protein